MSLAPVEEDANATLPLALADKPEILLADELRHRQGERLQQMIGRRLRPHPDETESTPAGDQRPALLSPGLDPKVQVPFGEEVVQCAQLGQVGGH